MILNKESHQALNAYLDKHNIKACDEREDLPVKLVKQELIGVRGSVHTANNRSVSAKQIISRFKKAAFDKLVSC